MTKRWTTCSNRCCSPGLTLIEVLAALAILGMILVSTVMARSRHTRQQALAERRMTALLAADELIAAWWSAEKPLPADSSGRVPGDETLAWRTRLVDNPEAAAFGARVLRVDLLAVGDAENQSKPLATVEMLVAGEDIRLNGEEGNDVGSR